ncbi:MAG: Ribosomal-protein-alanine N-acetyltransferase [Herbinix sp.]|jgi:ribosomal-protein-alanine N-acetyltransferase|nr:Ribosomal-protein-alanine N-acetyltransferase [Herbinix sp.]
MLMTYETNRLILKILHKDSAPEVLAFYEENKSFFEPWEPKRAENFYTLAYQRAVLAAEYHNMSEGNFLRYWVFLKDHPEEIIGTFCFQNFLKLPYQSCCIGYKYAKKHTRNGYAYESVQKGISVIFEDFCIHRIEAFIMPSNLPSRQLIEKLNFEPEGLAKSLAKVDGIWTDHLRFAIINPKDLSHKSEWTHPNSLPLL